jgi:hypothetical protein
MPKLRTYAAFQLFVLMFLTLSCTKSKDPGLPREVVDVINASGINRTELLKALVHYQNPEDSLKQKALYFLIANLPGNYTYECVAVDSLGDTLFSDFQYDIDDSLFFDYLHLVRSEKGKIIFKKDHFQKDLFYINHHLLISTVDQAFSHLNQTFKGQESYSFTTFCRYLLPYRVDNEPLDEVFTFFKLQYGRSVSQYFKQKPDLISLVGYLHYLIHDEIKFKKSYCYDCSLPSMKEIKERKYGNYRQLAIYESMALRTFGIASTIDFSPFLADTTGGYFWPVVLYPDGKSLPLMAGNKSLKQLTQKGRLPKVYRRVFFRDTTNLFWKKKPLFPTPRYLGDFYYQDVTKNYVAVRNVSVKLNDTSVYAYLSVFNGGSWEAVAWSECRQDSSAVFKDMGQGIVYLPMLMKNEKLIPSGKAFLLNKVGVEQFSYQKESRVVRGIIHGTDQFTPLKKGKLYHLYLWGINGWEKTGQFIPDQSGVIKAKLLQDCLYLISSNSKKHFESERIFSLNEYGEQVFY